MIMNNIDDVRGGLYAFFICFIAASVLALVLHFSFFGYLLAVIVAAAIGFVAYLFLPTREARENAREQARREERERQRELEILERQRQERERAELQERMSNRIERQKEKGVDFSRSPKVMAKTKAGGSKDLHLVSYINFKNYARIFPVMIIGITKDKWVGIWPKDKPMKFVFKNPSGKVVCERQVEVVKLSIGDNVIFSNEGLDILPKTPQGKWILEFYVDQWFVSCSEFYVGSGDTNDDLLRLAGPDMEKTPEAEALIKMLGPENIDVDKILE